MNSVPDWDYHIRIRFCAGREEGHDPILARHGNRGRSKASIYGD